MRENVTVARAATTNQSPLQTDICGCQLRNAAWRQQPAKAKVRKTWAPRPDNYSNDDRESSCNTQLTPKAWQLPVEEVQRFGSYREGRGCDEAHQIGQARLLAVSTGTIETIAPKKE